MVQTCTQCQSPFEVTEKDRNFYARIAVPEPKQCPECRLIRRLMERNARSLYIRTCDFSGKQTISQHHPKKPFPVYDTPAWWGDQWDAINYGMEMDFSRPFFDQLKELKEKVPQPSNFTIYETLENSTYNNCVGYLKNCYLLSESDYCEDCYYSNRIYNTKDLSDCSNCYDSELCYECIDCRKGYNLLFSQNSENCKNSYFLKNCIGCTDCVGCINQRQQQYMIFNVKYSKEEYEQKVSEMQLDTGSGLENARRETKAFFLTQPNKAMEGENNQNVLGNNIYNSKNAINCFDVKDLEDVRYGSKIAGGVKDCMDYTSWGFKAELIYQSAACGDNVFNLRFCSTCTTNVYDATYCISCTSSNNIFGCIGLKKKRYCILNKQYSENDYTHLVKKIIEHMKATGEWGEFLPLNLCTYGYNETIAMDHFPLSKEEALKRGYPWSDYQSPEPTTEKHIPAEKLHESIAKIPNDVLNWAIICEESKKPFRITAQELSFYRTMNLPLPKKHPIERHKARMEKRTPYKLFTRPCAKCNTDMQTTYAPARPEIVYCEQCYLQTIY